MVRAACLPLLLLLVLGSSSLFAQQKLELRDTPAPVQELIKGKYAKYRITAVSINKEQTEYHIELEKGEKALMLDLAADGRIISKTKTRIYSFDGDDPEPSNFPQPDDDDGQMYAP